METVRIYWTNKVDFEIEDKEALFQRMQLNERRSETSDSERLLGRALLMSALGKEIEVNYSSTGRPGLKNNQQDFNISHAGELVACAVVSGGHVGVDIDQNRFAHHLRFMVESGWIGEPEKLPELSDEQLVHHWIKSEALYKCLEEMTEFPAKWLEIKNNRYRGARIYPLEITDNYTGYLASEKPLKIMEYQYVSPEMLIEEIMELSQESILETWTPS